MTFKFGKSMFNLQKKYLAFFGIVPLLLVTALIQTPCPSCSGTGKVSSTNMDTVTVAGEPHFQVESTFMQSCNMYRVYRMHVTLELENEGEHDANGFIALFLHDVATGKELSAQKIVSYVGANMKVTQTMLVTFMVVAADDPEQAVHIVPIVRDGAINCLDCDGSSKVPMNTWLLRSAIKQTNEQLGEYYEVQFVAPLFVDGCQQAD